MRKLCKSPLAWFANSVVMEPHIVTALRDRDNQQQRSARNNFAAHFVLQQRIIVPHSLSVSMFVDAQKLVLAFPHQMRS